jgi:hypothetical protein
MSNLIDHIAILTNSSLAQPVPNKLKGGRMEYYAVIAFPPAAGEALHDLCKATGAMGPGVQINVKPNASGSKPIPGVPGDWLVVRAATQYAPFIADETGAQLDQAAAKPEAAEANRARIRSEFYAGKRVRAAFSAYAWSHATGGKGISFNVDGVMAVADGERLAIGNGAMVNAFAHHAQPAAAGSTAGAQSPFATTHAAAAPAAAVAQPVAKDPFAQPVAAQADNPFFA